MNEDAVLGGMVLRPDNVTEAAPDEAPGLVPLVHGSEAPLRNEAIYGFEIDQLSDKPWTKRGADLSAYFNYGFNEDTWREYCLMQPSGQKSLKRKVEGTRATANRAPVPNRQPAAPYNLEARASYGVGRDMGPKMNQPQPGGYNMPGMVNSPLGRQAGVSYQQPHRPQMPPVQPPQVPYQHQQYLQQQPTPPQPQQYSTPGVQNPNAALATLLHQSGLFNN
eukprot:TRINITY_DN7002_c0_g1_i2.p1 TRINITY_DN7002_c0_g1~~TRINITY_DN7002_c0_g1_i2.p1  ORF type:complete len:221 (+),score=26.63 TRINITY_DN7002_c0_g1_i2:33-695(+)